MDGGRKCCNRQTCPTQKHLPSSERMYTPRQWSSQSARQDAMQQSQQSSRTQDRSCTSKYSNAKNNSTQILFVEPNFMETPSEYDVFYDCFSEYDMGNQSKAACRVQKPVAILPNVPCADKSMTTRSSLCPARLPEMAKKVECSNEKEKDPCVSKEISIVKQKDLSTMLKNLEDPQCFRVTLKQVVCTSHKLLKSVDEAIKKCKLKKCSCKFSVDNSQQVKSQSKTTLCPSVQPAATALSCCVAAQAAPIQTALVNPVQTPCGQPQAEPSKDVCEGSNSAKNRLNSSNSTQEQLTLTIPVTINLQYEQSQNAQPRLCIAPEMQNECMEPIRTAIISACIPSQPMTRMDYDSGDCQNQLQSKTNIFQCSSKAKFKSVKSQQNISCHCIICEAKRPKVNEQKSQYSNQFNVGQCPKQTKSNTSGLFCLAQGPKRNPQLNATKTKSITSGPFCLAPGPKRNPQLNATESNSITSGPFCLAPGPKRNPQLNATESNSITSGPFCLAPGPKRNPQLNTTQTSFLFPSQQSAYVLCCPISNMYGTAQDNASSCPNPNMHGTAEDNALNCPNPNMYGTAQEPKKKQSQQKLACTCNRSQPQPQRCCQHSCPARPKNTPSPSRRNEQGCPVKVAKNMDGQGENTPSCSPAKLPDMLSTTADTPSLDNKKCTCKLCQLHAQKKNDQRAAASAKCCRCQKPRLPCEQTTQKIPETSCGCQGLDNVKSIMNPEKLACNCGVASKQQTKCTCQVLDSIKSVMKQEVKCPCKKDYIDPKTIKEVKEEGPKQVVHCTCHALDDVKSPMKDERACNCPVGKTSTVASRPGVSTPCISGPGVSTPGISAPGLSTAVISRPGVQSDDKPSLPPKPRRLYRLARPQHRELKLCTPCRYDPSPLIDKEGNVICPYNCGCCLCPWQPRATDSQIDRLNHEKISICKCRERNDIFDKNCAQGEVNCSKDKFFDMCPCREKAEAKYLELYGQEMWTAGDKLSSHANNQTQTDLYRNNEYLDETQDAPSPFCCIARPITNDDTSTCHKSPENPISPNNSHPSCFAKSERVVTQSHYPSNYSPDISCEPKRQPIPCAYDRVETEVPTTSCTQSVVKIKSIEKSRDNKFDCKCTSAQNKNISCIRPRSGTDSLQSQATQPAPTSADISPERYRPCGIFVKRLPKQTESCENSEDIPYEKNLAMYYEKCTEKPPPFSPLPLPCEYTPRESRELRSEPSGYQATSELVVSNYYDQRPVRSETPSKSQTFSCKFSNDKTSYVQGSPSKTQTCWCKNRIEPQKSAISYDEKRSVCDAALSYAQSSPSKTQTCCCKYRIEPQKSAVSYNEKRSVCEAPSIHYQKNTCYKNNEEVSNDQFKSQPCQSNYSSHTPCQVYSALQSTMPCKCFEEPPKDCLQSVSTQPQAHKCPYCIAIEEQQQQQMNVSHMPIDMNACPCLQESEFSSHGTTPCTYVTTDTENQETQESSTASNRPVRTLIGCSYLSDEVFYSLSSESSEQDLTSCSRKNRQWKKHRKHGKTESKARNIVILQLLHEVVHLISDDESTKVMQPPVKRKIRNISAIGTDEADVGAFSSRTNLSSIKITILPGQTGSTQGSRPCTEGSEVAAPAQPAQGFEVSYPMKGSPTVPCNLYIAPNLTCSNPDCNSRQGTPTSTYQQGKYSQGSTDKQNFFNWNPGTETINYAMDELSPNSEVICEPEIIEPEDQYNCIEPTARSTRNDRSSDRYQGDDSNCFERNTQSQQKPTRYDCCDCSGSTVQQQKPCAEKPKAFVNKCDFVEPSIQGPTPSKHSRVADESFYCFMPTSQQSKSYLEQPNQQVSNKERSTEKCRPNGGAEVLDPAVQQSTPEPAMLSTLDQNIAFVQPAVMRLKPSPNARSINTEYAFSSRATTSSGEIGDRPTRSNRLQYLTMTPIDARTEIVPSGDEKYDSESDCREQKEENTKSKEENCSEKKEDECENEKEKSKEKNECCDCCHCRAMRAKQNTNPCNTIATPQQVLDDGGVTEMKYFIDSIILDLDAMEAARRSKLGPQRSRQPSICPRQSFPVTIMDVTDLGSSSLYVKWCIHDCYGIGGYEIYVDGHLTNRYFHCNHEAAVICDVDVTEPHKIVLLAQPRIDDNFNDFCCDKKNTTMDLVKEKCRSLLKINDIKNTTDSNKAVNAPWTPSIYYYDPVIRKANSSQPRVYP